MVQLNLLIYNLWNLKRNPPPTSPSDPYVSSVREVA